MADPETSHRSASRADNRGHSAACEDTLRHYFAAFPQAELAILFGSSAAGRADRASDLDVGLRLAPDSNDLRREVEIALARLTRREIDLIAIDDAPPLLRFEIARTGQLLVERRPFAWADFRARAMLDWWDWAPTARAAQETLFARIRQEAARGAP